MWTLLFFTVLFAFAAIDPQWIGWAVGASILVVLLIVEYMFGDDQAFLFEPNIRNYARRTAPQ